MKYYKIRFENLEPLCISNDNICQSGQTDCLKYIPGTTIRGHFINKLAKTEEAFEKIKFSLFSNKVCFWNAYPFDRDEVLIPSPKGFYEDKKSTGIIENVLIDGNFNEGMKRASLGVFSKIVNNTVSYYQIETNSNMKIKIADKDQKVFRSKYIEPGYIFESYIVLDSEALTEDEIEFFDKQIEDTYSDSFVWLGNGKSQGFGKCKVNLKKCDHISFEKKLPKNGVTQYIYMLLLSDTTMRDENGEYSGLNCEELGKHLGVDNLKIEQCSTSVVTIHGYNQKLGSMTPTVPMYEKGSVFKLSFDGEISITKMKNVFSLGIGERKNEGFGRVLFLDKEYERIERKSGGVIERVYFNERIESNSEDKEVLKLVAKNYFRKEILSAIQKIIPEEKKGFLTNKSQVGKITALLDQNRNKSPEEIRKKVNLYFEHAIKKENNQNIQKERQSIKGLKDFINKCLTEDIKSLFAIEKDEVFGFKMDSLYSEKELMAIRIYYVSELAKYYRKGN